MHLAEPIKVFLAMRRVKREGKHLLLKFKSRPHGVFCVWHLLKSHYEKWVQKSPEALRHLGFLGWHPLRMHNMGAEAGFFIALQSRIVANLRFGTLNLICSLLSSVSLVKNNIQLFLTSLPTTSFRRSWRNSKSTTEQRITKRTSVWMSFLLFWVRRWDLNLTTSGL